MPIDWDPYVPLRGGTQAPTVGVQSITVRLCDDAGDVVFKSMTTITHHHGRHGSSTSSSTTYWGFLAIRKSRDVEALLRETLIDPYLLKHGSDD